MSTKPAEQFLATNPQRIVLHAPGRKPVRHLILQFERGKRGLEFLRYLNKTYPPVFDGVEGANNGIDLSVGFSYRGLEQLGIPRVYLSIFSRLSPAFAEGAPARAAAYLGDTGSSAAERWEYAFGQEKAHALITLYATDPEVLSRFASAVTRKAESCRVRVSGQLDGTPLGRPSESGGTESADKEGREEEWVHFGYRDGLTAIRLRGRKAQNSGDPAQVEPLRSFQEHESGEFLLGRPNDAGYNPWVLATNSQTLRRFFVDGSFGVLRKMQQHEDRFQAKVTEWARAEVARRLEKNNDNFEQYRNFVKAKLCGRWPDGRPFAADGSNPVDQHDFSADFTYDADQNGHGCPFGAHIRRMNPRGNTVGQGVVHARQRPLMRRGTPYGERYDPQSTTPDERPRGLLGLFFCASIEDQFEHLLGQWGDRVPIGASDSGNGKDPLIGNHEDADAVFPIPCGDDAPKPYALSGFEPFVTTRGTMYAFYPSRNGLDEILADNYVERDDEEGDRP